MKSKKNKHKKTSKNKRLKGGSGLFSPPHPAYWNVKIDNEGNYEFNAYGSNKNIISKLVDNEEKAKQFFDLSNDFIKDFGLYDKINVKYVDGLFENGITIKGGFDDVVSNIDNELVNGTNITIIATTILLVIKSSEYLELDKKLRNNPNNDNIKQKINDINTNSFTKETHSVILICDKNNKNIYFYDPNGETSHKVWYYINDKIFMGCNEIKELIDSTSKLSNEIFVPEMVGIQSLPKGYSENNLIKYIYDYRPQTPYIDCGWCMFYNLFAIEYIISSLYIEQETFNISNISNIIKDAYYKLVNHDYMYDIFPKYSKLSTAYEGIAHETDQPLTIEKYSYIISKRFSKKLKNI